MKTFQLEGKSREIIARSADQKRALKAMRQNNEIPAVLYGGEKVVHFAITNDAVRKLIYTPEIFVVELTIDGQTQMAIMKEIQFHPTTDAPLHVDFYEVNDKKPITIGIPVKLTGLAQGVRDGGRMNLSIRKINVTAPYQVIPEHLDIDVTELKIGKSIKVGDLSFEGLELATSKAVVVCSIKMTRNAQLAAQAADDAEA